MANQQSGRGSGVSIGRLLIVPLFVLMAILQSTLVPLLRVADGMPNLPLLFVVSWLLLNTVEEGLIWAFAGGLTLDLLSSAPFGTSTVALVGAVCAVELLIPRSGRNNLLIPLVAVALATTVYQVGAVIILALNGRPPDIGSFIGSMLLPTLGLNLLLMLPVYRLLGGANRHRESSSATSRMGLALDEYAPIRRGRNRRQR